MKSEFIISIPAHDFCAASLMRGKSEIRGFIDGICMNNGLLFGTDGHSAFYAKSKSVKLPKTVKTLVVKTKGEFSGVTKSKDYWVHLRVFSGNSLVRYGVASLTHRNEPHLHPIKMIPFEVYLNDRIPDIEKVIPKETPVPLSEIGVNLNLMAKMAKVQKIFSSYGSVLNFTNQNAGILVKFHSVGDETERGGIIMPMRL